MTVVYWLLAAIIGIVLLLVVIFASGLVTLIWFLLRVAYGIAGIPDIPDTEYVTERHRP